MRENWEFLALMVSVLLTLDLLDMFEHFSVILKALSGAVVSGNLPKFGSVLTSKVRPRTVILNVTLCRCFGRSCCFVFRLPWRWSKWFPWKCPYLSTTVRCHFQEDNHGCNNAKCQDSCVL